MRTIQRIVAACAAAASIASVSAFATPAAATDTLLVGFDGTVWDGFMQPNGDSAILIHINTISVDAYGYSLWYGLVEVCTGHSVDGYNFAFDDYNNSYWGCNFDDGFGTYAYSDSSGSYLHTPD